MQRMFGKRDKRELCVCPVRIFLNIMLIMPKIFTHVTTGITPSQTWHAQSFVMILGNKLQRLMYTFVSQGICVIRDFVNSLNSFREFAKPLEGPGNL